MIFKEYTRFCWKECASFGSAIDRLADRIAEVAKVRLHREDQRAMARMMIRCSTGKVEVGPDVIEWAHDEDLPGSDVLFWLVKEGQ